MPAPPRAQTVCPSHTNAHPRSADESPLRRRFSQPAFPRLVPAPLGFLLALSACGLHSQRSHTSSCFLCCRPSRLIISNGNQALLSALQISHVLRLLSMISYPPDTSVRQAFLPSSPCYRRATMQLSIHSALLPLPSRVWPGATVPSPCANKAATSARKCSPTCRMLTAPLQDSQLCLILGGGVRWEMQGRREAEEGLNTKCCLRTF